MNYLKNAELRLLALFIKTETERFHEGADPITVVCNGVIISGRPVSRKIFLKSKQNEILKSFEDFYLKNATEEQIAKDEQEAGLIENIHKLYLIDAQYYIGDKVIPSQGGTHVVVNMDSIDAYNFGKLSIDN